ncbi:MAG: hypothetical protein RIC06_11195 [Cyclobacteriaceae bacterium]
MSSHFVRSMPVKDTPLQKTLEAIPVNAVKRPIIPVDVFIQEAHDLYVWISEDLKQLYAAGLDKRFVESLPERIDALQLSQSQWINCRESRKTILLDQKQVKEEALQMKNDLVAALRFAFREDHHIQKSVADIMKGTSSADLAQDLSDLAVLAGANKQGLKAIGFDIRKIKLASEYISKLADATALWNVEKMSTDAREMRDRAYTHLLEAVHAIRVTGRYVFRDDKVRITGYRHRYRSRR